MILNFYLFKVTIQNFEEALSQEKLEGDFSYEPLQQKLDLPFQIRAYFQKNKSSTPKWLSYISDFFEVNVDEIVNTSNSLVLLIKVENRIFAITSGFGYTAINKSQIEHDFGLRVVLNEINPLKIAKIDSRNIDTTTKQKMVFINRNSPLNEFEFDFHEDLLSQIGGIPTTVDFGKSFVGSDSLRLNSNTSLPNLEQKCRQLLEIFQNDNYKKNFPFFDYLQIIKDPTLIATLNQQLELAIVNRQQQQISMAYPNIEILENIYEYKIYQGNRSRFVNEIEIDTIYNFLDDNPQVEQIPEKINIIGVDQNGQPVTVKWSLYDFLVFETENVGNRYIYTLNKWFLINPDYYDEVQHAIDLIEVINQKNYLPNLLPGEEEGVYNNRASQLTGYFLLDKRNFQISGNSKVEVCDLLTPDRRFICVKKYNGSSTLSHLFNQGLVSADLLAGERSYREYIHNQTPNAWGDKIEIDGLIKTNIKYVFAIASSKRGRLVDILPFFSKVSLRYAVRAIEKLGFSVSLYKIRM